MNADDILGHCAYCSAEVHWSESHYSYCKVHQRRDGQQYTPLIATALVCACAECAVNANLLEKFDAAFEGACAEANPNPEPMSPNMHPTNDVCSACRKTIASGNFFDSLGHEMSEPDEDGEAHCVVAYVHSGNLCTTCAGDTVLNASLMDRLEQAAEEVKNKRQLN